MVWNTSPTGAVCTPPIMGLRKAWEFRTFFTPLLERQKSPLCVLPLWGAQRAPSEFARSSLSSVPLLFSLFPLCSSPRLMPDQDGERSRSVRAPPNVSVFGVRSESGPQRQHPRLRMRACMGGVSENSEYPVIARGRPLSRRGASAGLSYVRSPRRPSALPYVDCRARIVAQPPPRSEGRFGGGEPYERSEDGRTWGVRGFSPVGGC